MVLTEFSRMSRRHCSQFCRQRLPSQIGTLNMRKLIVGLLTLLGFGCLFLSGCERGSA